MRIQSVGRYLPERVVTAKEVAERIGVEESWILERAGVAERRWANDETPVEMAASAVKDCFERTETRLEDVDLIIHASATPQQFIPDTAALLQRELGLGRSGVKSFSVHATCLSFMTALDIADSFIALGRHGNVLITSAEIASKAIDFSEPESACLLGDMATAVLVSGSPGEESNLRSMVMRTYGDGADLCQIEAGAVKHPLAASTKPSDYLFHMDGPELMRFALEFFPPIIGEAVVTAGLGFDDIDLVIPHQASLLAIRTMQRALGASDDQIVVNIDRVGNCVAASLPGALYDAIGEGRVDRGDTLLFAGTGAGLSMAAAVITW